MSGIGRLQPFMSDAYRLKVISGQSDEPVCVALAAAMQGDSELALLAVCEVDRLNAFVRARPHQCYISKVQSEFLTRALERIKVG